MKIGDYISWPLAAIALGLIAAAAAVLIVGPESSRVPIVTLLMAIASVTPSFARSLGSGGCALAKSSGDTPTRGLPLPRALHIPPAPPMPKRDENEDDDDRDPPDSGASAGPMHDHIDGEREDDDGAELHRERVMRLAVVGAMVFGVLGLAGALTGCGVSALRVQAGTAHVVGVTLDAACHRVAESRQAAQEAADAAAATQAEAEASVGAVRASYEPAVAGCNAVAEAHGAWADALVLAAAGEDVGLEDGIGWARRLIVAWGDLVPALAAVGVVLPGPPDGLTALVGGAQ